MDRFDLEDKIMKCWNVTEDLKTVLNMIDRGCTEDELSNALIGIVTLYEAKFNDAFETLEDCIKNKEI